MVFCRAGRRSPLQQTDAADTEQRIQVSAVSVVGYPDAFRTVGSVPRTVRAGKRMETIMDRNPLGRLSSISGLSALRS